MESAILSIYNKIKVSPLGRFIGRHPKKVIVVLIGTYLYIQRSRDRKKRIEQEKERKLLGLSESVRKKIAPQLFLSLNFIHAYIIMIIIGKSQKITENQQTILQSTQQNPQDCFARS